MGSLGIIKGFCLFVFLSGASGAMKVGPDIAERAEKMYDEKPSRGPTGDPTMRSVKDLTICLRDEFTSPVPQLQVTARPPTTDVPTTTPARCVYGDRSGNVIIQTAAQRQRRSQQLKKEIKKFHNCICRTSSGDHPHHCDFNMLETDYNRTVLESCLGNNNISEKATLTYRSKEFHCHLRNNFTVRCHPKQDSLEARDTKFLSILVCLSRALDSIECDRPGQTTYRDSTTTTSPVAMSLKFRVVFLVMIVVLGLLLGILGTVCGVFCWRRRKKRSVPTTSIVKRTGPRVPLNTYEHRPQDNVIYEELPDTGVPDLLQQGPTSVVHSKFGGDLSESVFVHSNLRSVTYNSGGQGYYEALARRTDGGEPAPSGTTKPVPAPRTTIQSPRRLSSGNNDYLDLEEDSQQTDGTQPSVSNPYFVLEPAETSPVLPEASSVGADGEYMKLDDENGQNSATTGKRDVGMDGCCSQTPPLGGNEVHDYQKLNKPSLDQMDSVSHRGDDYEFALSPDAGFDLATTYKQSEEDRNSTCSPDYQRLTGPAIQQHQPDTGEPEIKNDYFVLEE
ncbi:uncharacterized protein LOC124118209 [Haliotis rufescens]|uniref:uncharacterized protein LOC124118209 n=1 Tax=Haliotis rufescens TaxID=6454 RepID=UPI001EB04FDB|nr:uncharacterized protein LOC124118209 [Haliotis rufescens]